MHNLFGLELRHRIVSDDTAAARHAMERDLDAHGVPEDWRYRVIEDGCAVIYYRAVEDDQPTLF